MKWTSLSTLEARREVRLSQWHKWFAWRPVDIDDKTVWLETLERKYLYRRRPGPLRTVVFVDYRYPK